MKKKIAIIVGALLLVIALVLVVKPKSFEKKFNKTTSNLTSYLMEGDMEIAQGEDVRMYRVTSSWMKQDDVECFKVSLFDKNLNQEQIILKNADGIFVITPSLNQMFEFKGEWPMNSPKPYLLQTLMDVVENEHKSTKQDDGWLITAKADYPSASKLITQEIKFNKDYKPAWLIAYNENKLAELKILFNNVEYNNTFDEGYFSTPTKKIEPTETPKTSADVGLPLYPVSVFDSKLVSSTVAAINGDNQHVLEFVGEKDFTVVQSIRKPSTELEMIPIDLELIDGINMIGYYDGTKLTVMDNQVEISVYSKDLTSQEMMQVVQSMKVAVMK